MIRVDKRVKDRRARTALQKVDSKPDEAWTIMSSPLNRYAVSNLGRIKNVLHEHIGSNGKKYLSGESLMSSQAEKMGYIRVAIRINNRAKYLSVHRLVAMYFIKNPENKPEVNHKDGNKSNNNVTNLEWCDRSHNKKHSYRILGEKPRRGNANGNSKLQQTDILGIRRLSKMGVSFADIGKEYNISNTQAWRICHKKSWAHL